MKLTDRICEHGNIVHEIARHDKYHIKVDSITVLCAFLLNFKSFVCTVSALSGKQLRLLIINIAVFSNLYTLYGRILFAAATNFNRFVVNVAY